MRIALDFHSVLNDLQIPWIAAYMAEHGPAHLERFGKPLEKSDITDWDIEKFVIPKAKGKMYSYLAEESLHMSAPPMPYAVEVTRRLAAQGHEFLVITDSVMIWAIMGYLKEHYPHIPDIRGSVLRIPNKLKAQAAAALGCTDLIEDYTPNLAGFSGRGWLINTAYNAAHEHPLCRRVADWRALGARLGVEVDDLYSGLPLSAPAPIAAPSLQHG